MEIRFMAIGNEKRTEEREMGEEEQISLSLLSTIQGWAKEWSLGLESVSLV